MAENRMTIGLFDPGMTHLHKVGLAGLYMTLKTLDAKEYEPLGGWNLTPHTVEIYWTKTPKDLLEPIVKEAFRISPNGLIEFCAHKNLGIGPSEKILLHELILSTYLQFGTQKQLGEESFCTISFEDEDVFREITKKFRPAIWYKHQDLECFDSKGNFKKEIDIIGWLFPGGVVRHTAYQQTGLSTTADKFLALLFAPVATIYFKISHKNTDGKYDNRKIAALIWPHLANLETYFKDFFKFVKVPLQTMYASSLGDAGLISLITLNASKDKGVLAKLDISSCTVVTLGTVGWSKQQKTRTSLFHIREVDKRSLDLFRVAWKSLPNRVCFTKGKEDYYIATSQARGLFAGNIASRKEWFEGFSSLMRTKEQAKFIGFERKEISNMIKDKEIWSNEADKLLVEAVHTALRNRYGALAERARQAGTKPQFGREFERIRTSLMRTKNGATLRAELADLFARGGINKTLQESWPRLLSLFTGEKWQRARDLALLGLASYTGKGVQEIQENDNSAETVEEI